MTKYNFIEQKDKEHVSILIEEGPYKNIVYHYGRLKVIEENDEAVLDFNYFIDSNPNDLNLESPEFEKLIGDILVNILENKIKEGVNDDTESDS